MSINFSLLTEKIIKTKSIFGALNSPNSLKNNFCVKPDKKYACQ